MSLTNALKVTAKRLSILEEELSQPTSWQSTMLTEPLLKLNFRIMVWPSKMLKKVSRLLTGAANDTIVPFPTYMCNSCGYVNKDLRIFDEETPKIQE